MEELAMAMIKPFLGPKCDAKEFSEMAKLESDEAASKEMMAKCEKIDDVMCFGKDFKDKCGSSMGALKRRNL